MGPLAGTAKGPFPAKETVARCCLLHTPLAGGHWAHSPSAAAALPFHAGVPSPPLLYTFLFRLPVFQTAGKRQDFPWGFCVFSVQRRWDPFTKWGRSHLHPSLEPSNTENVVMFLGFNKWGGKIIKIRVCCCSATAERSVSRSPRVLRGCWGFIPGFISHVSVQRRSGSPKCLLPCSGAQDSTICKCSRWAEAIQAFLTLVPLQPCLAPGCIQGHLPEPVRGWNPTDCVIPGIIAMPPAYLILIFWFFPYC